MAHPPAGPAGPVEVAVDLGPAAARRRAAVLLALRYDQLVPWLAFAPASGDALATLTSGAAAQPVSAGQGAPPQPLRVGADLALALTALHGAGLAHGALDGSVVHLDGPPRGDRVVARLSRAGLAGLPGHPRGTPAGDVRDLGLLLAAFLAGGAGARSGDSTEAEPEAGRPPGGVPSQVWDVVLRLTGPEQQRPSARAAAQALSALASAPAGKVEAPAPAPPQSIPRERLDLVTAEPTEPTEPTEATGPTGPTGSPPALPRRRTTLPRVAGERAYVAPRAAPLRVAGPGGPAARPGPTLPHHDAVELELHPLEPTGLRGHHPSTVLATAVLVAMALLVTVLLVLVLTR